MNQEAVIQAVTVTLILDILTSQHHRHNHHHVGGNLAGHQVTTCPSPDPTSSPNGSTLVLNGNFVTSADDKITPV